MLFHRDLRLTDNTALTAAVKSGKVLPVFIFPPEQIKQDNPYFSHPAVQFMCESLEELDADLRSLGTKLHMYKGQNVATLSSLHKKIPFTAVYSNEDRSVYAVKRDEEIKRWCEKMGIEFVATEDYDLVGKDEGMLPDGRPYTVLSQYFARFKKDLKVRTPERVRFKPDMFAEVDGGIVNLKSLYTPTEQIAQRGGRSKALSILKKLTIFKKYAVERDYPALNRTTKLSAHLKFGTVSVREVYHALKRVGNWDIIRELVFRSFYVKIYTHDASLQRGKAYRAMDKHIPWHKNKREWDAWRTGTTGYPLCDAGMRQLAAEAWVHNRVRMLVASVPTRYLLLNWRDCAQYFYTHLVDADIFSNTAGWQWSSGVGPDAAPYFRAPMNPFIQSKKFDKDAEYIKKWIPELQSVKPEHIHRWDEEKIRALYPDVQYPAPIVEQKEASSRSLGIFKKAYLAAR